MATRARRSFISTVSYAIAPTARRSPLGRSPGVAGVAEDVEERLARLREDVMLERACKRAFDLVVEPLLGGEVAAVPELAREPDLLLGDRAEVEDVGVLHHRGRPETERARRKPMRTAESVVEALGIGDRSRRGGERGADRVARQRVELLEGRKNLLARQPVERSEDCTCPISAPPCGSSAAAPFVRSTLSTSVSSS